MLCGNKITGLMCGTIAWGLKKELTNRNYQVCRMFRAMFIIIVEGLD